MNNNTFFCPDFNPECVECLEHNCSRCPNEIIHNEGFKNPFLEGDDSDVPNETL